MAKSNKIRIKLKAYDHKLIDQSAGKIIETDNQIIKTLNLSLTKFLNTN